MATKQDTYKIERSQYNTWIVWEYYGPRRDRVYETTNKIKAQGVLEYLTKPRAGNS